MRYLLVVSLLALVSWSFAQTAEGDPVPSTPLIKTVESKEGQKDIEVVKINDQYLDALKSSDAVAREFAVKALMKLLEEQIKNCKKPYLPKLNNELNSEAIETRAAAIKTISDYISATRQTQPKRFDVIYRRMAALDTNERDAAKTQLFRIIEHNIISTLINKQIEALASSVPTAVAEARQKLKEFGEDAAEFLVDAISDERPSVRNGAAEALKDLGAAAKGVVTDLSFMLDNDDKNVRQLAGQILENLGADAAEAVEDLVEYLENDEKSARRIAANILKKMGPAAKAGASDLAELLSNDDKSVRALAVEVLNNLGPNAADGVEALANLVDDANADADSRCRAAQVLSAIGPNAKGALEILKKHLGEVDPQIKAAISAAIANIEGK